jgi:hypothetical protein
MYNALFESIIRTSGADTDDIHSGEAEGNLWAENQLFEQIFKEAHLREMADVTPENFALIIRNTFTEQWHINLNEKFAIRVTEIAINEASKIGGLNLLTSQRQEITINNQTGEERNKALHSIKAFVDSVKSTLDKYAEKNIQSKIHEQIANYCKDLKRTTQLYTALTRRIAKEFSLSISEDEWKAVGFVPFG